MTASSKHEVAKSSGKQTATPERRAATRGLSRIEDFERMFDDFLPSNWMKPFSFARPSWSHLPTPFEGRMPHVDVVDREKDIYVEAELPGIDKNDVEITVTDYSVTIKGSSGAEEKEEEGDYYRHEISHGTFCRTVSLPSEVDSEKAKAKFKHGVLKLTLPKVKQTKHKVIKVD